MLKCNDCDKIGDDVIETVDPYNSELNNDNTLVNLCSNCYQESINSI